MNFHCSPIDFGEFFHAARSFFPLNGGGQYLRFIGGIIMGRVANTAHDDK